MGIEDISEEMNGNNILRREFIGIVNQLFDLAEVPVEKRQSINDIADNYVEEQFYRLFNLVYTKEHSINLKEEIMENAKYANQHCAGTAERILRLLCSYE